MNRGCIFRRKENKWTIVEEDGITYLVNEKISTCVEGK